MPKKKRYKITETVPEGFLKRFPKERQWEAYEEGWDIVEDIIFEALDSVNFFYRKYKAKKPRDLEGCRDEIDYAMADIAHLAMMLTDYGPTADVLREARTLEIKTVNRLQKLCKK